MFAKSILKNYSSMFHIFSRVMDPLLVVVAALIAYEIRFSSYNIPIYKEYKILILFSFFLVLIVFPLFNLYTSWRGQSLIKQSRSIFLAWITVVLITIIVLFGLKISSDYSRLWLSIWAITGICILISTRIIIFSFLQYERKRGKNLRYVIIVGAGDLSKRLLSQIDNSPWTGYKVKGLFDDNPALLGTNIDGHSVVGNIQEVDRYLANNQIDEIWIALPMRAEQRVKELLYDLRHQTVNIKFIPDIFGFSLLNHSMTEIAGLPAVNLSETPMWGGNQIIKALEDRVLGVIIFIFIFPVLLIIAAIIKATSSGPIMFKQKRHGWDGRIINVYKFRTMKSHNEKCGEITQAVKGDSRITPFGAFLRKTSLDELPQFYNVLQGRMSIVGPRPHAIQHNEMYKDQVNQYMLRHMVKPGITGWAQVNGLRGETDTLEKMKKRVEYDLYYIENWSLWFDLKIIFLTIFKGFINKNAY